MKVVRLLILLAVLVAGFIIRAFNSDKMVLSLGFTQITTTTGLAIIVALLSGAIIGGGIVLASLVIPLYAKLRKAQKAVPTAVVAPASTPSSTFDGR